jgi:Response regulator containing a CheY-like receiver domain and an HTH DNA-binding domain
MITTVIFSLAIILLCVPKTKEKTNVWFAGFLFSAGTGYPVAILQYYILPETNNNTFIKIIAQFISAFGFRFSPYFLLQTGISYTNLFSMRWKRRLTYLLPTPGIITFILDFIFINEGFLTRYICESSLFWDVSIWAVPYGLLGNFFVFHAYYTEQNRKRKKQKLGMLLITLPTLFVIVLDYGSSILKINGRQMWVIRLILASISLAIFIIYLSKSGILGVKMYLKFEQVDLQKEELMELVSQLTVAQREVLLLKLQGKTNQEIAEMRNVSLATIKSQINAIHKKLNIKSIDELKHLYSP